MSDHAPTSTHSSLVVKLYPELVDLIIDNVAELCRDSAIGPLYDLIMPPCDKALLRACALVCRSFLARSRHYLFDTLAVENGEDGSRSRAAPYQPKNYNWTRFTPPTPPTGATLAKLQFYATRPDISQHVRFIFIFLDRDAGDVWNRTRCDVIEGLRKSGARPLSLVIVGRPDNYVYPNMWQDLFRPLLLLGGHTIRSIRLALMDGLPVWLLQCFPKAEIVEFKAVGLFHSSEVSLLRARGIGPHPAPKLIILNFSAMRLFRLVSIFPILDPSHLLHFCAFAFPAHPMLIQVLFLRDIVRTCQRIHTIELAPELIHRPMLTDNDLAIRVDFSPLQSLKCFRFYVSCHVDPPGVPIVDAIGFSSRLLSTFHLPPTLDHFHAQIHISCRGPHNSPWHLMSVDWRPLDAQLFRICQGRAHTPPLVVSLEFIYNTGNNPIVLPTLTPAMLQEISRTGVSLDTYIRAALFIRARLNLPNPDLFKDVKLGRLICDVIFLRCLPLRFIAMRQHQGFTFNITYHLTAEPKDGV